MQQALLKIIEGTLASVPPQGGRKHPHQEMIQIDTTNILFIVGGAFEGLDKVVETRLDTQSIGFAAEIGANKEKMMNEALHHVQPEDLVKYGIIPEFIGRLPVTVALDNLDRDALVRILTEPKNAIIKQYKKLLNLDGVKLSFDDAAVEAIADKAVKRKTGARGLRSIIEETMTDVMFRVPSDESISEVIITRESAENGTRPLEVKFDSEKKSV